MTKTYTKNTWTDEVLGGAERYDIKENGGAAFKSNMQIDLVTPVAVAGTPVNASRMNNLENGVDTLDDALNVYTTGGTSTAYTLTTPKASALTTGEMWRVKFHATAGTTPTLNRDGKGAKSLKYYSAGSKVAITSTIIYTGMVCDVYYDGTDYVLLNSVLRLDELAAPTDVTTLNASTTAHGLAPKATAPASGLINVLGIANGETAYSNKALFDSTAPAALGTAAAGTATVAARRDHVHASPEPSSYIFGCKLEYVSATSIKVNSGLLKTESGDRIEVSSITLSSLSLSASTIYHIYVYLSGGTPTAEASTTAPATPYAGTARSKTGATGRRYVGSIVTDGSGNVKPFEHSASANLIAYVKYAANASPHRCLNGGTATTATAVSLSGLVPTTSRIAQVRITNSSDVIARTSDDNGVGASQVTVFLTAGNTAQQSGFLPHPIDSSQQIWYAMASSPSTGGLYIDVQGYYFDR